MAAVFSGWPGTVSSSACRRAVGRARPGRRRVSADVRSARAAQRPGAHPRRDSSAGGEEAVHQGSEAVGNGLGGQGVLCGTAFRGGCAGRKHGRDLSANGPHRRHPRVCRVQGRYAEAHRPDVVHDQPEEHEQRHRPRQDGQARDPAGTHHEREPAQAHADGGVRRAGRGGGHRSVEPPPTTTSPMLIARRWTYPRRAHARYERSTMAGVVTKVVTIGRSATLAPVSHIRGEKPLLAVTLTGDEHSAASSGALPDESRSEARPRRP
jgi:hypothetical protein